MVAEEKKETAGFGGDGLKAFETAGMKARQGPEVLLNSAIAHAAVHYEIHLLQSGG